MHLSGLNLLSFPSLQDLILRFYLFKNKEATARISVKQEQFSKSENKSCLMLQFNRKGSHFLKSILKETYKLNLQQLLDKQMASHFLGKVKILEALFINLQSQVLHKKCQPVILFSACTLLT